MKFNIAGAPAHRDMSNRNLQYSPQVFKFDFDKNNKVFEGFSPVKE